MIRIEKFALRADYLCPHHDDLHPGRGAYFCRPCMPGSVGWPSAHQDALPASAYFIVGIEKSAPARMPVGQRRVTVFIRVKKRTPSGPCMFSGPKIERFQPPKQ